MASGRVQFTGTITGTPAFGGNPANTAAAAFDGDFTTFFVSDAADGRYFYIDHGAGNTAVVDQIRIAARMSDYADGHIQRVNGGQIQSATDSGFTTSLATLKTLDAIGTTVYMPRQWTTVAISTSTARRYWRYLGANGSYATLAEFRFDGPPSGSTPCRPMPVDVSPAGGRFPSGFATVTMTCETTSASIYYTTDGSTPDQTDTLYSGPIQLNLGASAVTLKAVAYDNTCSTTLSEVVTHTFNPWGFKPNEAWYDTDGVLIEAHGGDILDNRARDGYFYFYGQTANLLNTTAGVDTSGNFGVWAYRSTDLLNWQPLGRLLNNTAQNYAWMERPRVLYNAASDNYVMWVRGRTGANVGYGCVAVSDDPASGWSYVDDDISPDGGELRDYHLALDGTTAYIVWTTNVVVKISALASNYQSLTGAVTTIMTADREAPILFKNGSTWYLITSGSNYYDADSTFSVSYITSSALLSGWPSIANLTQYNSAKTDLFASDPVGGDFNGQPTSLIQIGSRFIYLADHWDATQLYDSRYVFVPLTFTGATLQASTPSEWNMSDIAGSGGNPLRIGVGIGF